eukprot:gene11766-12983_t
MSSKDSESKSENNQLFFEEELVENKPDKIGDEIVSSSSSSSASTKMQSSEPCRTPIERSLLAHFFFIFAVSFFLGVIFLHSTLRFWSWQVNDINEYGGGNYNPQSDGFLQQQQYSYQNLYKIETIDNKDILTITLSPNMTLSLKR